VLLNHLIKYFFVLLLILIAVVGRTQETREELEKKAETFFNNEQFVEATPYYLRLLSLDQRNPNYNYKYGTCLLYNSRKKDVAFKYLNFAVSSGDVDVEAYYYLGRAYHLTYQFKKAIENYEKYKKLAGARASNKLDVDRQIQMCRNGLRLLSTISETVVLKKQEIDASSFFRIYDLGNIGGELIVTADFQTRIDKKYNHVPLIHFPAKSDVIFYSSFGEDERTGKDIYMRTRLPNGTWSLPQKVKGDVNTSYDEDFPYMHPKGRYLYFASKGHNSMGGYDVFRSLYDPSTNSFGPPENMDFPISSADDDMLYIVDSLDRYAYFASKRESEANKVHVYHLRVERFPSQIAIIKGTFNSTIDPRNKELEIVIYHDASNDLVGTFLTSDKGEYLISLPKGGKYRFELKVGGKTAQFKQVIDVPYLKEFRPLKQRITETTQSDAEIVLIENLFDELFDDPIAVIAEVIQMQSRMTVNKDQFNLDSLDNLREQRKILATVDLEQFSPLEIRQMAQTKVDDLTKRLENSETRLQQALSAMDKAYRVKVDAIRRADSLLTLANNTTDEEVRKTLLRRAEQAYTTAKNQEQIIESSDLIIAYLEKDITSTQEKLVKAKQFNDALKAVPIDDENGFLAVLTKNKEFISKELKVRTKLDAHFEMLEQINQELKKAEELRKRKEILEKEQEALSNEKEQLESQLTNAKKKEREAIESRIQSIENQLDDLKSELRFTEKQLENADVLVSNKNVLADLDNQQIASNPIAKETILAESRASSSAISQKLKETSDQLTPDKEAEPLAVNKTELLNRIDPTFQQETQRLMAALDAGTVSENQVIARQEQYLNKLEKAKADLQKEIDSKGASAERSQQMKILDDEIAVTQSSINELKQTLAAKSDGGTDVAYSPQQKAEFLNKVDKNYAAENTKLQEQLRSGTVSENQVIARQEQYLNKLEKAKADLQKEIDSKGASAERSQQMKILDDEIAVTQSSINELKQTLAAKSDGGTDVAYSPQQKAEFLNKVDKNYAAENTKLQEQLRSGTVSENQVIARQEQYLNKLEKQKLTSKRKSTAKVLLRSDHSK
jgi:hypothetical protein